jgi:branched-chain amino acid transport system ATP-binding protein
VRFHGTFQALFGLDLDLAHGETIALIGANGAGKTTLLRSVAGALTTGSGRIVFDGEEIQARSPQDIAARGIASVPEGRRLFPSLSVQENLLLGATSGRRGRWNLDTVYELFPILRERRATPATRLSGGQQQMVAIGRALMANPRLLLCDEISLGLAPLVIGEIYQCIRRLKSDGLSLIIVEQDVERALGASDRVYCLRGGQVALSGMSAGMLPASITGAYFGAAA